MRREISAPPLISLKSALKGFLGGSLLSLGVFASWGFGIQALIFLVGFFVMLETFLPFGAYPYIVTAVVFAIAGIVASYLIILAGQDLVWTAIVLIITAAVYLYKSVRMLRTVKLRFRKAR